LKKAIIDFKPKSERICTLRIRTKIFNMTVILGDLNAKISKQKEYRGVIGTESLHDTTNHNGIKLIDFAESYNLIISSTYFPHKNIHNRTWAAPDGVTFNQIVSARLVEELLGIPKSTVHQILTEYLGRRKVCARFVPHALSDDENDARVEFFFSFQEQTINMNTYLDMPQLCEVSQIEHLQPHMVPEQDGAPPHWARWIDRDGPMSWPPRSPDTTPLDCFLWGYTKSSVFRRPVNGLDDLKTRIRNAISATPADMLYRTWQELEYRLDVLRATKGAHIEVYRGQ
ncbi:hypothetical protein B7P43_G02428, partial [Cryptotermes secundus]